VVGVPEAGSLAEEKDIDRAFLGVVFEHFGCNVKHKERIL